MLFMGICEAIDRVQQGMDFEWLFNGYTRVKQGMDVGLIPRNMAGGQDTGLTGRGGSDFSKEFDPRNVRHIDVGDDNVIRMQAEMAPCLGAISGLGDVKAVVLKEYCDHPAQGLVIVDEQDGRRGYLALEAGAFWLNGRLFAVSFPGENFPGRTRRDSALSV